MCQSSIITLIIEQPDVVMYTQSHKITFRESKEADPKLGKYSNNTHPSKIKQLHWNRYVDRKSPSLELS